MSTSAVQLTSVGVLLGRDQGQDPRGDRCTVRRREAFLSPRRRVGAQGRKANRCCSDRGAVDCRSGGDDQDCIAIVIITGAWEAAAELSLMCRDKCR